MVTELFANTIGSSAASTTLAGNSGGAITSGATTLKVASNNGFSVTGGQMRGVLEPGTANAEVVIITGISTLTFTVTRGQEGTTAVAHNDGSVFIAEVTAGALGNMLQTLAGSDGNYYIRRSGLWVPDTPSYADLSGVPASFTPSGHASTHNIGGSDVLEDRSQFTGHPQALGYTAWAWDPTGSSSNSAPTAGVVNLTKIMTPHLITINTIAVIITTGGSGVTALANCFVGLYDSGGTRRFASADQSAAWGTAGVKSVTISGGYLATGAYVYVALLVGTQSSTQVQLNRAANASNGVFVGALTASTARAATNGTGQTSLPNPTITLASNGTNVIAYWAAIT